MSVSAQPDLRQRVMLLYAEDSGFQSRIVAWTQIDGTGSEQHRSGDSDEPPYQTVIDAIRDGWRLIQMPPQPASLPGSERQTGHFPYEFVLERIVESAS